MIAIIAEKPSVGQEIARVVGATEKKDGYITGNGYMVTWALGHLVSLALPGTYGYTRTTAEDLPMLPEPFRLVERQIRTDRGMVTDIAAGRQLKVMTGCSPNVTASSWRPMPGVRGNSSSGGYIPTWAVPSLSNTCGSPRLPMRPSERGWQTSGKDMNTTASMPPPTAVRRPTGWWA